MRHSVLIAAPIAEAAVRFAERNGGFESGKDKRAAALAYVRRRLHAYAAMIGDIDSPPDSELLGLIDATVAELHESEEFAPHETNVRQYQDKAGEPLPKHDRLAGPDKTPAPDEPAPTPKPKPRAARKTRKR